MLIIGELINTSRKPISEAVEKKDSQYIRQIAKAQEEAGADYLDVNCGTFVDSEKATMEWLVEIIEEETKLPLCLDSPNPVALEAALNKTAGSRPMINSITYETRRINSVLPLIKKYNTRIIALCIEDSGMPKTNEDRLRIASLLIDRLTKEGIALDDIYIDPLIKPISTDINNGIEVLEAVHRIMSDFPGVHTVCGLTNISYSLPARTVINRTFMIQAMSWGMDSFIIDPTNKEMKGALLASQALLGQDKYCRKFITGYRQGLFN
jgi:cobalamin-dependent methionine synthase I